MAGGNRSGWRFAALLGVALVLSGLVSTPASVGLSLYRSACQLQGALRATENAKVALARKRLLGAMHAAHVARAASSAPGAELLGWTPLANDLRALGALGSAVETMGAAGLIASSGLPRMPQGRNFVGELYRDGRVRVDRLASLADSIGEAVPILSEALRKLEASPPPTLGPIERALGAARTRLVRGIDSARRGELVLDALPNMLGADGTRRYFLAFQSPSEARGGGGLLGVYGILRVDDGAITLEKVEPVRELVPKLNRSVRGPAWFKDLYGNLLGLSEWREANLSPIFPATSEIILRMYERSTGERLDGVVALDPIVLGELTRGTGPLKVPGLDRKIDRSNAAETLMRDIYTLFRKREGAQNGYIRRLVERVYTKLQRADVDLGGLAKGLGVAAAGQHLKVYARDPISSAAVEAAHLDGNPLRSADDVQMVFTNNFAANKIDYFVRRHIDTRAAIEADGDALVSTTVTLDNEASGEETSVLVNPGIRKDLPSGLSQMSVHLTAPQRAVIERVLVDGRPGEPIIGREGTNPSAYEIVEVPAGGSSTIEFLYRVPKAVSIGRAGSFFMTLWPQAAVRDDTFSFGVAPPEGWHLNGPARGRALDDGAFLIEGKLNRIQKLSVRLARGRGRGKEFGAPGSDLPGCASGPG